MNRDDWRGVMPAHTNPYREDLAIDHERLALHVGTMRDAGCTAIVTPGSLGEGGSLSTDEKSAIWRTCREAVGDDIPVVAAIGALSTDQAVATAKLAETSGCSGLMILPAYAYVGSWPETREHFAAVLRATPLSSMLYNNPIAYRVDVHPTQLRELTIDHGNLHAVKESSGDIRRFRAIREILEDRLAIFVGIDDMAVEGVDAGADGWIAGLVNALPEESVRLWKLACDARATGRRDELEELYRWFLPLLRLDAIPEFVHMVNLVQAEFGMGDERLRGPRRRLSGEVRAEAIAIIDHARRTRPNLD